MSNLKSLILGASLAAFSVATFAQAAATPRVDARQAKQETRTEKGVSSGRLTETEANRLDKQQGRVDNAEAKAKADGTVTAAERRHVTKMQNRSSANIYHQKHDPQRTTP